MGIAITAIPHIAVNAASEAFQTFSKSSQQERIDLLKNIIKEYENRYKDFVEVITKEMGLSLIHI